MSRGRKVINYKIRKEIHLKYQGLCHLCYRPVSISEFTVDHINPISTFSKEEKYFAHYIENLAPAHEECNKIRGNLSVEDGRRKVLLKYKPLGVTKTY